MSCYIVMLHCLVQGISLQTAEGMLIILFQSKPYNLRNPSIIMINGLTQLDYNYYNYISFYYL